VLQNGKMVAIKRLDQLLKPGVQERQFENEVYHPMAPFASLVIRTFQLIFSAGTIFFSHNKSTRIVFRLIFSAKRTGPISRLLL